MLAIVMDFVTSTNGEMLVDMLESIVLSVHFDYPGRAPGIVYFSRHVGSYLVRALRTLHRYSKYVICNLFQRPVSMYCTLQRCTLLQYLSVVPTNNAVFGRSTAWA